MFSIWQTRLPGRSFLDLFCGGGAVGLEAASRGAARIVFVDRNAQALGAVKENCRRLEARHFEVRRATLPAALSGTDMSNLGRFDLVFADPPYAFTGYEALLIALPSFLVESGELAVEHATRGTLEERIGCLERFDLRTYGDSSISFFRYGNRCGPNGA